MEVMEAIKKRRAIRSYAAKPVDRKDIEELLQTAVLAASPRNTQQWAFGVIQGADVLRGYSDRAKAMMLAVEKERPLTPERRATYADPQFNIFRGAPALVIMYSKIQDESMTEYACAMAGQNFMLAALDRGLGTCWIGSSRWFLNTPDVKRELGVPVNYVAVAPIIIGYPEEQPSEVERKAPEMVFWK